LPMRLDYAFVGPHAGQFAVPRCMIEGAKTAGKTIQQRHPGQQLFRRHVPARETRLGITMLPKAVLAPHVAAGRIRMVGLKEDWALRQMAVVVRDLRSRPRNQTLIDHRGTCATT